MVQLPAWDFRIHARAPAVRDHPGTSSTSSDGHAVGSIAGGGHLFPADVIIVEGLLIFHNQELLREFDLKVFVDCEDADVRLFRRLSRDLRDERGRDFESVEKQYFSFVKPNYEKFVVRQRKHADIIIPNSRHFFSRRGGGVGKKDLLAASAGVQLQMLLQHVQQELVNRQRVKNEAMFEERRSLLRRTQPPPVQVVERITQGEEAATNSVIFPGTGIVRESFGSNVKIFPGTEVAPCSMIWEPMSTSVVDTQKQNSSVGRVGSTGGRGGMHTRRGGMSIVSAVQHVGAAPGGSSVLDLVQAEAARSRGGSVQAGVAGSMPGSVHAGGVAGSTPGGSVPHMWAFPVSQARNLPGWMWAPAVQP